MQKSQIFLKYLILRIYNKVILWYNKHSKKLFCHGQGKEDFMKELLRKLREIQANLHVGKTQYNDFGKYMFRNQEDILEAVKPMLEKAGLTLLLTDELLLIGERYSREELAKKGMDSSQVTGSSSSYARKYALGGMFLLDESKDADTLNKTKDFGAKKTVKSKLEILKDIADEAAQNGIPKEGLTRIVQHAFNVASSKMLTLDQVQNLQANYKEYWKEVKDLPAEETK